MNRVLSARTWVAATCLALYDHYRSPLQAASPPFTTTADNAKTMAAGSSAVPVPEQYRILIIGKTGNGKSTLGNKLLDREAFKTGRSMSSTTLQAQASHAARNGVHLKVVDTPDVTNIENDKRPLNKEIKHWKELTSPSPSAILLAIRCDVRYTAEEYEIYTAIKESWGDNTLAKRLIVAFTFGDRQDRDIHQELKTVNKELKNVLRDANHRYVVFNNQLPNHDSQVLQILRFVDEMEKEVPVDRRLQIGLFVVAFVSGLTFHACYNANKKTPAIVSGVVFALAAVSIIALAMKK